MTHFQFASSKNQTKQDVNSLTNQQKTYGSWHETYSWQAKDKKKAEFATTERHSMPDVIGRWHMNIRIMLLNSMQEVCVMR